MRIPPAALPKLRWDPYVLQHGANFFEFWDTHLKGQRDILFIMGAGFDPRTTLVPEAILRSGGPGQRNAYLLNVIEDEDSATHSNAHLSQQNKARIFELFKNRGQVNLIDVPLWSGQGSERRRVGSRNAMSLPRERPVLKYSDVVLDVSALSRSLYFPLLGSLLHTIDECQAGGHPPPNLHVTVAENASLDSLILDFEPEEMAAYLPGFVATMGLEASEEQPKVWIPVLGERQEPQLKRIYDLIAPNEISPLLPSPSLDPRRGDNLIVEYQELLFEAWNVVPSDIVYASERNPFEVYRRIISTFFYHEHTLSPLGGCRPVVSAHSSKLLSLGAMLAAYDSKTVLDADIAIAHVDVGGYSFSDGSGNDTSACSELVSLWLTGECYG